MRQQILNKFTQSKKIVFGYFYMGGGDFLDERARNNLPFPANLFRI